MDTDKLVHNTIDDCVSVSNSDIIYSVTRPCQICGGATNSLDKYICEECRNGILKLLQEDKTR